jgi:putative hydrolase of the HAD superfamily
MKLYKHIFFDLDHTLWDFETNSRKTLEEIYQVFHLQEKGIYHFEQFYQTYLPINDQFWYLYHHQKVSKEELRLGRFRETLSRFNIEDEALTLSVSLYYLQNSPHKNFLFPHAVETLRYLKSKYELHIITNGFKEVQHTKIIHSGLHHYITHTIISEEVGFQKPNPEIFEYAIHLSGAAKYECLMVGDNIQTDIEGALNVGIDSILFNPKKKRHKANPTFEVNCLSQLSVLL